MSGMWGNKLKVSIFGESHGEAIGINIDGLPAGITLDMAEIDREMARRAPNGGELSTPRKEEDKVKILSGYFDNKTTGTPLCGIIFNNNTKSSDYSAQRLFMRPSHSDYGYFLKSGGNNDYRGGGHSSGRLTAPLVFCGAICKQLLASKNIKIVSHILSIADIKDDAFDIEISDSKIACLKASEFATINKEKGDEMRAEIAKARRDGDSVGGIIECAVVGIDGGVGEPFFESVESKLAGLLFSVPAVKGVEFGKGYAMTKMRGSVANDQFAVKSGKVVTTTNNNGGVVGGITNGMPIVFNVAIKPTPSIFCPQQSVNISTMEQETLTIAGRHDPCVVVRAGAVIEAVTAMAIYDLIK